MANDRAAMQLAKLHGVNASLLVLYPTEQKCPKQKGRARLRISRTFYVYSAVNFQLPPSLEDNGPEPVPTGVLRVAIIGLRNPYILKLADPYNGCCFDMLQLCDLISASRHFLVCVCVGPPGAN